MDSAGTRHAQIVIGSDGVDHVHVGARHLHQFEGVADDAGDVLHVMGSVESGILGQDLGLNELYQIKAWNVLYHKKLSLCLQIYEILRTFANKMEKI